MAPLMVLGVVHVSNLGTEFWVPERCAVAYSAQLPAPGATVAFETCTAQARAWPGLM